MLRALYLTLPLVGAAPIAAQAPDWLSADTAAKTVRLALEVTSAPDSGAALINGHRSGDLQIIVPAGWTVRAAGYRLVRT